MAQHTLTLPTKPIQYLPGLPLVGNLLAFNSDRLGFLLRIVQECGDVGGFHFGPFPMVFFSTSEHVQSILVEHASDFQKGEVLRRAFRPVIGNGLFISEGDFHRRQRKRMAPIFQPRQIKNYADAMVRYGERIQQEWRDGVVVDVEQAMTQLTMSIIGKVLFDEDMFSEADELGAAMKTALEYVNVAASTPLPLPFNWPLPRNIHARAALAVINDRIQAMIEARRAHPDAREDCLSLLMQAKDEDGNPMSDQQVFDEAVTLFGAGHETTATALTWAWYLLATHAEAYEAVRHEVDRVLGGRSPTYDDLVSLPYTLQVLKESLRLYPPAYGTSRVALREVVVDGYRIRKGQTVVIAPYAIHRRSGYFPNPERFDPERFALERERQLPRYAFLPFGAGPRICIGNHFALMEGHLLLATLAQRVMFELVPGQQVEPDPKVTIRPRSGIKMVVYRRKRES